LVVSDCVAPAWFSGAIARLMARWSETSPVVLVQVLPRRLWAYTALGNAQPVWLIAGTPAAAGATLQTEPAGWGHSFAGQAFQDSVPREAQSPIAAFPVVTLDPSAMRQVAEMIAGAVGNWMPGMALVAVSPPEDKLNASELVQHFRESASPTARRLAGLLAASPICMSTLWLLRQLMLPEARPVHAAELWLLKLLEQAGAANSSQIQMYEFVDGVRELLLDAVPVSISTRVLTHIRDYLPELAGHSIDIRRMLATPDQPFTHRIEPQNYPFAHVAAQVLRRLGVAYQPLVASLEQGLVRENTQQWQPEGSSLSLPDKPALPDSISPLDIAGLNEEIDHVRGINRKLSRRLRLLNERNAIYGINTPPEIVNEIEYIQSTIQQNKQKIERLKQERNGSIAVNPPEER
jgi:hypothetical protein